MGRRVGKIAFIFVFAYLALGVWSGLDYYTYYGTTDQTITFAWDPPTTGGAATSYDWRVLHVERNTYILQGNSTVREVTIQLPRTGHYIIEIRAKNSAGTSQWIKSTDSSYSTVGGQPKAWWIYGHVAGPGPIIIK